VADDKGEERQVEGVVEKEGGGAKELGVDAGSGLSKSGGSLSGRTSSIRVCHE
jgi:hypothetical protein